MTSRIQTLWIFFILSIAFVSRANASGVISPSSVDSLVNNAIQNSIQLERVLERMDTSPRIDKAALADSILTDLFGSETQPDLIPDREPSRNGKDSMKHGIKNDTLRRMQLVTIRDTGLFIPFPIHMDMEKIKREMILENVSEITLLANPLYTDMIFRGYPLKFDWKLHKSFGEWYFDSKASTLDKLMMRSYPEQQVEQHINDLRAYAVKYIRNHKPELFAFRQDQLKNMKEILRDRVDRTPITKVEFADNLNIDRQKQLRLEKLRRNPWTRKANALLQFSQNYVSPNWYQGGSDNVAILGIVTGQLNYDNKKNIQWDNNLEWRTGFNTVDGDTLRLFNTNDDILKINSKLGFKAGGNWFYSGSVDFSTQFFNSFKAINSMALKTTFLTPVRLNVSVGLDYKYKKLFSVMLSPVSFKYIYLNDIENINPGSFGVVEGKELRQFGSSFKAQTSFTPLQNIQVDSRLNFYTNYHKVEIDWEVVGTFTVNRFLSTRLSLNPRFDNTVILNAGERAKLQFKELLTFGLSYKF